MFAFLRNSWEAGLESPFIEEMFSNMLSDFAPYAGADQQQLRFVRRQTDGTTTSFVSEESGEWAVRLENPHVGATAFTTRGEFLFDVRSRIPLWLGFFKTSETNNNSDSNSKNNNSSTEFSSTVVHGVGGNPRRFILPVIVPQVCGSSGAVGVLELLFLSTHQRYGGGLRVGPFSLRLSTWPRGNEEKNNADSTFSDTFRNAPVVFEGSFSAPMRRLLPGIITSFFPPSLRASLALQHPVGGARGDTLAALCIENTPCEQFKDIFRFLFVQTLISNAGDLSELGDMLGSARSTLFAAGVRWNELGTLIGVTRSFRDNLLRVSLSSMLHGGDVDYESAFVVDATPIFANPTQFRFGVNKIGRVGLGIATRLFDGLLLTLGMHHMRGGETQFGLEIAM